MKYSYEYAKYPSNKELLLRVDKAAEQLYLKFQKLDLDSLQISDYIKEYLKGKINNRHAMRKDAYILSWALSNIKKELSNAVFLEYGGGVGTLSLLAKELGVGTVIYNDIYDVSCRDARTIATVLDLVASDYLHGDINDVVNYFRNRSISCDAVASYDVIEHIYDLSTFFTLLPIISTGNLTIMMASGANNANPKIKNELMQKHLKIELTDREATKGHKERDSLKSYFSIRKNIIEDHLRIASVTVTDDIVDELAKRTRGLIKSDIEERVSIYLKTNKMLDLPEHPTNTCDPLTGNWAEHLFDPEIYRSILENAGMDVKIMGGFTDIEGGIKRQFSGKIRNLIIGYAGPIGLRFAPFFSIYAKRMT